MIGQANPILQPELWDTFLIGNLPSPGTIAAIQGFERKYGWQVKQGKGASGATTTLVKAPPARGKFTLAFSSVTDFSDWDLFQSQCLFMVPVNTKTQALAIYHPMLNDRNITSVVLESIDGPRHMGRGLYHVTIEFIEWTPVQAQSIVTTPNTSQTATIPDVVIQGAGSASDSELEDLTLQSQSQSKPSLGSFTPGQ